MKITVKRILGIIGLLMAIGFGVFVYGADGRCLVMNSRPSNHLRWSRTWYILLSIEEITVSRLTSTIYFDRRWDEPLSFRIKD